MPDVVPKRYEVKVLPSAQRDLDDLSTKMLARLLPAIESLGLTPRPHGSIKLTAEEGHRLRVGDYRVLYRMDDPNRQVFVYRVKHRRDVYR